MTPQPGLQLALGTHLEATLEALEERKSKALMLWLTLGQRMIQTTSSKLNGFLGELENLTLDTCFDLLDALETDQQIRTILVQEFGPKVTATIERAALLKHIEARLNERLAS